MSFKERLSEMIGIWLCVYPSVLVMTYVFRWVGLGWPLWGEVLVSTALTVPLISFLAVPKVRAAIALAEGTTKADLARREAREAERETEAARAPGE